MVFIVGGQVWAAHSDSSTQSSHASTEWDDMKAKRPSFGISRRVALTTAAVLPILFGFMLPISQAQAQTDPLPSWHDGNGLGRYAMHPASMASFWIFSLSPAVMKMTGSLEPAAASRRRRSIPEMPPR